MEQFHFLIDTPIILHRCDNCEGLWIGSGELTQMSAALVEVDRPATEKEIAMAKGIEPQAREEDAHANAAIRAQAMRGFFDFHYWWRLRGHSVI
jgi:hypothetical protein